MAQARRTVVGKLLLGSLGLIVLASLGPKLRIAGAKTIPLPWALTEHVPFVRMALPARFMLHAWLLLALVAALWLAAPSQGSRGRWGKWTLAGVCIVALLPNLTLPLWNAKTDTPTLLASNVHRRYLERGRTTLVVPFASNGFSMLWQAESGMAYPLAGGYIACQIPPEYQQWAIVASFLSKRPIPGYGVQVKAFLGHFDVANVVIDRRADGPWRRVFGVLPVRPVAIGRMLVYRMPDELLARYRHLHPRNIERRALRRACQ